LLPRRELLLPLLGDWKISLPLLRQELWRGLILNRLMEPNAAPSDAHFEIDSIILNAPVADVYAYCSRFEELPRFITSVRDLHKIDETHFSFTSLLDGKEYQTVLQIMLRIPERRIAWQAISDVFPRGLVLFEPLSDRMTEITVRLYSSIEPATLARVTRDYLMNLKRFVEQG
jgi:uncharacterized membrane protein